MPRTDSKKATTGQAGGHDRWCDLWLVTRGESLRRLVADLRDTIEGNEARGRKRKGTDQAAFCAALDFLVADLATAAFSDPVDNPSGKSALALGKAMGPGLARYGHPLIRAKTLASVVKACEQLGVLELIPGYRGKTSTVAPSLAFMRDLQVRGVTLGDIGRVDDGEEVIVLSKKRREEAREGVTFEPRMFTQRLGYVDTPNTHAMRQEVLALNTHMARLDLAFIPDGEPMPDINQRRLRRHFTLPSGFPHTSRSGAYHLDEAFSYGGRLFGAFWLNLSKQRRRASLRIAGERIAEADYSAMFIRLAYGELGTKLPESLRDDPYAIQGWPEGYRGGLKAAFNAMLFSDGSLARLPPDIMPELPSGWTAKDIREVILKAHPALGDMMGSRVGFKLMRRESDILLAVLRRAIREGLEALPLHDALLVPQSRGDDAKTMMMQEGERIAGVSLRVDLKG